MIKNSIEFFKLKKKTSLKEAKRQFIGSRKQLGLDPIEKLIMEGKTVRVP